MNMNNPSVAIVYLSFQSRPYIDEVVSSVANLDYPKEKLSLIIVDNASVDESAEYIDEHVMPRSRKDLPEIIFFPMQENKGFAEGNNIGINHALLDDYDYVYLLNNDAKLDPQAIREAVLLAESDKTIGSVQSTMCLWQDPERLNSTGGMVQFLGFGFVRDNGLFKKDVHRNDGEEIAYASGAAVLYRSTVLKAVGLLDPFLFLYHEDLELGWRIRLYGFKNVLSTKSVVFHYYEFKRSIKKFYWMERNRFLVHLSHLKITTLILLTPFMLVLELALILFAIKGGFIKEKLFSYAELLKPKTWGYIKKKRKESQIIRKVSDRQIVKLFTAKIEHQETSNIIVEKIANPSLSLIWWVLKKIIV